MPLLHVRCGPMALTWPHKRVCAFQAHKMSKAIWTSRQAGFKNRGAWLLHMHTGPLGLLASRLCACKAYIRYIPIGPAPRCVAARAEQVAQGVHTRYLLGGASWMLPVRMRVCGGEALLLHFGAGDEGRCPIMSASFLVAVAGCLWLHMHMLHMHTLVTHAHANLGISAACNGVGTALNAPAGILCAGGLHRTLAIE